MATSILLDKEIEEYGHDDIVKVRVKVTYASASDTVILEAGKESLYIGTKTAQEFAKALAEYIRYYGTREAEEELKRLFV